MTGTSRWHLVQRVSGRSRTPVLPQVAGVGCRKPYVWSEQIDTRFRGVARVSAGDPGGLTGPRDHRMVARTQPRAPRCERRIHAVSQRRVHPRPAGDRGSHRRVRRCGAYLPRLPTTIRRARSALARRGDSPVRPAKGGFSRSENSFGGRSSVPGSLGIIREAYEYPGDAEFTANSSGRAGLVNLVQCRPAGRRGKHRRPAEADPRSDLLLSRRARHRAEPCRGRPHDLVDPAAYSALPRGPALRLRSFGGRPHPQRGAEQTAAWVTGAGDGTPPSEAGLVRQSTRCPRSARSWRWEAGVTTCRSGRLFQRNVEANMLYLRSTRRGAGFPEPQFLAPPGPLRRTLPETRRGGVVRSRFPAGGRRALPYLNANSFRQRVVCYLARRGGRMR